MGIVLGDNRYGKAEVRLVRVDRDGDRHALTDLTVGVALAGDLAAVHLAGDNARVLPTDTQKNTVYAFAADGVGEIEDFGLRLARHFVDSQPAIGCARVHLEQHGWERIALPGGPAPHSFVRTGQGTRTATVGYDGAAAEVVSGLTGLTLVNTTGSEFRGFARDRYTTLPETTDRILATAVDARWRHAGAGDEWAKSYAGAVEALVKGFVNTYSSSLQQTLMSMGSRVLETRPEIAEIRLALPNRHHYLVDLSPFDLTNDNEVFIAGDRPYGLIEGTVTRDDAAPARAEWYL